MTSKIVGNWNQIGPTYKTYPVFCEPGLISVLFLSFGKNYLVRESLAATHEASLNYEGDIEWCFLEQGNDDINFQLFRDFPSKRKVIIRQDNFGINNGLNQLFSISRGEYCFIHESDWLNKEPNFDIFGEAKRILNGDAEIGVVQCRAIWDQNENWGLNKPDFNPWSCQEIKENKLKFFGGINNNPCLVRKSVYREIGPYPEPPTNSDPKHGETEYQQRYFDSHYYTAHLKKEVYYHIGGSMENSYRNKKK